jgi:HlyD family secretion protein
MESNLDLSMLGRASVGAAILPPRRGRLTRLLLPVAVFVATVLLCAYAARDSIWPALSVDVMPVVPRAVAGSPGNVVVQAPGWVEPDPYPIHVSSLADGVVSEILVLEGQTVSAGQVVARLVDDDARLALARAAAQTKAREAELAAAAAALRAAQREWDHPVERRRALAAAQALLSEAEAELARHPHDLAAEAARLQELHEEHRRKSTPAGAAFAEMEVLTARLRFEAQEAVVQSMRARRQVLEARLRHQEAELEAARQNLELRIAEQRALDEAQAAVARAAAALEDARAAEAEAALRLARMLVRSPADGVVMQRLVEPGAKLVLSGDDPSSSQVLRLYDPRRLQVRVDVPLAAAAAVGIGQSAQIVVGILPERTFDGQVTRIAHEADIQKNTVQFKVAIADPAPQLRPQMLARVRFLAAAAQDQPPRQGLFVPQAAVSGFAGDSATVWIADGAGRRAAMRQVRLGELRLDGWVQVIDGLAPGDRVIVSPQSGLRPGQRIRIAAAAGGEIRKVNHGTD